VLIHSLDDLWRNIARVFGHRLINDFWLFDLDGNNHLFTVMLFHGGFFAGSGKNAGYVDGKPVWFDYYCCDCTSWVLDLCCIVNKIRVVLELDSCSLGFLYNVRGCHII
jgi:hypothetical protein